MAETLSSSPAHEAGVGVGDDDNACSRIASCRSRSRNQSVERLFEPIDRPVVGDAQSVDAVRDGLSERTKARWAMTVP